MDNQQMREITSLLVAIRAENGRQSASIDRLGDALAELKREFSELSRLLAEDAAEFDGENDPWGLWSDHGN